MMKPLAWLGMAMAWSLVPFLANADDTKKGPVVTIDGLRSPAPADWKEQGTTSQMRAYQFKIPAAKGDERDAELVIFFFGPGGGGSVADNLKRWKGFFIPPEDKKIDDVAKVEKLKVSDVDVVYLDVEGTYRYKERPFDPNAKEELRPDWRMLGVIFASKKGPYYFRLVGPAKTVAAHKKDFDDWLKAFK
jgi:hypothetical protein